MTTKAQAFILSLLCLACPSATLTSVTLQDTPLADPDSLLFNTGVKLGQLLLCPLSCSFSALTCTSIQTTEHFHLTKMYATLPASPYCLSVSLYILPLAFSLSSVSPSSLLHSTATLSVRLSVSAELSGSFLISLLPMRLSLS